MDKYSQIAALLREITGTGKPCFAFWLMEVVSVDGDTCSARIGDLVIPGIRLSPVKKGAEKGLLITPAGGSSVLVADLSAGTMRELAVIGFTEIAAIELHVGESSARFTGKAIEINGGSNNGLANVKELTGRLNLIERDINALKSVFKAWTPVLAGRWRCLENGTRYIVVLHFDRDAGSRHRRHESYTLMKGTGILLDPETSDLKINTARDARGLIAGGLEIGRTTYQNQAVILQAHKGEFKEYPLLGAGISDILGDDEITAWKREISLQLESDGMTINTVEIDTVKNKVTIDAEYHGT